MQIEILLFGILRDVIGQNKLSKEVIVGLTLEGLREELSTVYPDLDNYQNYTMAVNEAYAEDSYRIQENDVIALIPPVSGG